MRRPARRAALVVLLAGIAYSLYLQALLQPEGMNLGDAGLKVLMTQQFARGDWHLDLRLPAQTWVRELWAGGLYPFKFGNDYATEGVYYVRFAMFFPLVSAPFYGLAGLRGLYVLPVLATWALWIALERALRALGVRPLARAATLAVLVFASFVTYYSATFWEHTAAVALAFGGLALVLARPLGRAPTLATALAGGALVGASTWFREELLCLVGAAAGLGLLAPLGVLPLRRWPLRSSVAWLLALAAPPAAMFAFNLWAFGSVLGMHGGVAAKALTTAQGVSGPESLRYYLAAFVQFFPASLLALLVPWVSPPARRGTAALFAGLAGFYLAAVPFLVRVQGKEWGPRFLIPAVPLLCVALAFVLDRIGRERRAWLRAVAGAAALAVFGAGSFRNTVQGTADVGDRYTRRTGVVRLVEADPSRHVAVSHEFMTALLMPASRKAFFLVEDRADLGRLARALAGHGADRFLYLEDPIYRTALSRHARAGAVIPVGRGLRVRLEPRGRTDRYLAFDAVIVGRSRP